MRQLITIPTGTPLMRVSWALFAVSLLLPAAHSTSLSGGRATYGLEIFISFPLLILNPLSLTHPLLWGYVTALYACNFVVLCSEKIRRATVEGRASADLPMLLALSLVLAISVAAGGPALVGASVERLLVGYYVWVLSIVTCVAALATGLKRNRPPKFVR
jgi:hypothetical protein